MKRKILYVEDEVNLGKIVAESLEDRGFDVRLIRDGARVLETCRQFRPAVCVLDVMLPNIDGYELGKEIRSLFHDLPVLYVTAKTQTADVVEGFRSGGTDYMRKPFSVEELVVRIHNQLHLNSRSSNRTKQEIKMSRSCFYPDRLELHISGQVIRLSNREAQILNLLASQMNRAIDRRTVLMQVWNDDSFFHSRNLDVYIKKLRNYFRADAGIQIITLKGKGYQFVVETAAK